MDWIATLRNDAANDEAFDGALAQAVARQRWRDALEIGEEFASDDPDRWHQVAVALEQLAGMADAASERAELLTTLGDVWSERLGRADQAIVHYQAAFKVDRGATRAIARARELFRGQQNWTMVQRLYQVQVRVTRDEEERARLLTEAGRVQRDALRDDVGARDYFEQALRAMPGYEPALDALHGDDSAAGDAELDALRARLSTARGPLRAELLYQIAEILLAADEPDEDPAPYLDEAVSLEPASPEGMRVVADHLRRREQWTELCDVLDRVAASSATPEQRAEAALEGMRVAHRELRDDVRAGAFLEAARAAAPASPAVVDAAVSWYEAADDWAGVVAVLETAVSRSSGGRDDLAWHRRLGAICAERLDDLERAEPHYRRVRMLSGSDDAMLAFYTRYHRQRGEARKLLAVLQTRRERASTPDAMRALSEEMAAVAETDLGDPVRAVDVWTWFLRESPDDPFARRELRRLLVATERWNRLLEFLKEELRRSDDAPADERLELQLQIARIYRDHVQLPMFEAQAYQAVLDIDPTCAEAVAVVRDRMCASQRWLEAATVLDRAAEATDEPELAWEWAREAGQIWLERAEDVEAARTSLEVAAAAKPEDAETLATLEELAARQGDGQTKLALLRRRAALLPDAERREALLQALEDATAQVDRREILGDLVDATGASEYRWVHELADVWAQAGADDRAAEVLERHVETCGDDVETNALLELAHARRRTDNPADAVPVYERVLARSPALSGAVDGAIDALARAEDWAALEDFAAAHDAWLPAADRVTMAARASGDLPRYLEAARICLDELEDGARAVDLLEAALELAPESPRVAEPLSRAYARVGDLQGRAQMLEIRARAATGSAKRDLQLELADLASEELDAPGAALGWLLAAFDADPTRVDVRDRALDAARALDRVAEWAAAVRRGAAALPEGDARLRHERCLARAAESDLDDVDLAIEFQQRVVAQAENDLDAWSALQRLYTRRARWDDVAVALEARFRATTEERDREQLAIELVALRVRELDGADAPVAQVRQLLARAPESATALQPLADALVEAGRLADAAEVASEQAALADEGDRFAFAATAAARRAASGAVELAELVAEFARLADAAPDPATAAEALEPLLAVDVDDAADRGRIADVVEPVFRAAERWDVVAAVLRDRVVRAEGERATAWTRELAGVEETHRGDVARAAEAWRHAVEQLPITDDDAREAERLATDAKATDALVRAWAQRIARDAGEDALLGWAADAALTAPREALDRRLRVDVHTEPERVGRWVKAVRSGWLAAGDEARYLTLAEALLADERLGGDVRGRLHAEVGLSLRDQEGAEAVAFDHLVRACHAGGVFGPVVEALVALGEGLDERARVLQALEAALELVPDARVTSRLHHELGSMYRDREAFEDAIRHYEAAVFVDEDPAAALIALDDLYASTGAHAERAAALERLAERRSDDEAAELRLEAARVHAGVLDDLERAIELAAMARRIDASGEATRLLRAWLRAKERWEDLAGLLGEIVGQAESEADAINALRERAQVLEHELGQRRGAAADWEQVRERSPADPEALEQLDRLYGVLAEPEARIDVLRQRLASTGGEADIGVRRSLMRAHVEQGDIEQAVAAGRSLLADAPGDPETLELLEALIEQEPPGPVTELLVHAYGGSGRWAEAASACRAAADRDIPLGDQLAWLERAERIEADENRDPAAAYALALERYRRSAGQTPRLGALRSLAGDVDGGATLALLLEERFASGDAADDELRVLLELMRAGASTRVDASAVAAALLKRRPDDAVALRAALAGRLAPTEEIDLLFRFLQVAEPAEQGAARVRLADVLHASGSHEEELAVVLDIERDATERGPWTRRADGLFHALGRHDALAERLAERARGAEGDEAAQAWVEHSTLQREHLDAPDEALRSIENAASVVGDTPAIEAAIDALQLDLSTPPEVAQAAALLLVRLRTEAGDVAGRVEAIQRALPLCEPDQRLTLRRQLAAALDDAGDDLAAFQAWADVLRASPEERAPVDRLLALAEPLDAWQAAADVLREVGLSNGSAGATLLDEAADVQERRRADVPKALELARAALRAEPTPARFDEVERLLYRAEAWDDLITWHRERAVDAPDPEAVALQLHRAARIAWVCAGDLDRAADSLLLALERQPADPEVLADADAVLAEQERWDVLAEALARAVEASTPPAAETVRRLAVVRAELLSDPLGAARTLRDAAAALPELVEEVEAAYAAAGVWDELTTWLEAGLDETAGAERSSLVTRIVTIRADELGDLALAWSSALPELEARFDAGLFDRAVEWAAAGVASDDELRRLRAVARDAEDASRELAVLACMASLAIRPEDAEEAAIARADLLVRQPGGSVRALEALVEGLQTAPDSQPLWTRTLGLASEPARAIDLAKLVSDGTLTPVDPEAAASVTYAVGLLALDVGGDAALGETLLLRAFELDPGAAEPLDALDRAYADAGRHADRAELIERAGARTEGARQSELLQRLARIYEGPLGDAASALRTWTALRDANPGDSDALEAIARLSSGLGRWETAVDAWLQAADELEGPERAALLVQAVQTALDHGASPSGFTSTLEDALEADPGNDTADRLLGEVLEAGAQWQSLVEHLLRGAEVADDDAAADRLARVARLRASELEDFDGAIEASAAAAARHDNASHRALYREMLGRAGRYRELVDALERALQTGELEDRTEAHIEIARIAREAFGDDELAEHHLAAAQASRPGNVDVALELARLRVARGRGDEAAEVLGMAAETAADEILIVVLREQARALLSAGRRSAAMDVLERAFELDPTCEETFDLLRSEFERLRDWEGLHDLLHRRAAQADGAGAAPIWRRIASLAKVRLKREDLARHALEQAHHADPDDETTAILLLKAYIDAREPDEALPLLEELTARAERRGGRSDLHRLFHLRGRIEESREAWEAALDAYQQCFKRDAAYVPNLLALGRVLHQLGRHDEALRTLQTALVNQMRIEQPARRVELYHLLGTVREALDDPLRASDMYERALQVDRDHAPSRERLDAIRGART